MKIEFNQEEKLKQTVGDRTPFKVPEGYFEDVCSRIMTSLPEYPEAPKPVKLSVWQKVKPYVYLAAMFAGIWCMMKMFYIMSSADSVSLDTPPEAVILAMDNSEAYDFFTGSDQFDVDNGEMATQSDVSEMYDNMEDFERDFGYELEPEYANM